MLETSRPVQEFKGVKKDPLDLRDILYEPNLRALPFEVDNRPKVPLILNQQSEGACTGFGLAAVANFLLGNRPERRGMNNQVSARMLYEMAKRYDEWQGEHYQGSSIRGAMKGWHKHGVCTDETWRYVENDPGRLTEDRAREALDRPLGAYFRVRHLHLNHMHSALNEVGILYASARVHQGWHEVDRSDGKVPFRSGEIGSHAFAIVGYDNEGFWVQNSWEDTWGKDGFCHISYNDWLENGFDCWVAQLGVPTTTQAANLMPLAGRAANTGFFAHKEAVLTNITNYYINLGNDGVLSGSGLYRSDSKDVEYIISENLNKQAAQQGQPPKLLLYAHGGLNDEKAAASRVDNLLPYFLANQIYPLHFMWETGLTDTVKGIVQDALRRGPSQEWGDDTRARFGGLLDEAIELGSRRLGGLLWKKMKDNAERASNAQGGAAILADQLVEYRNRWGAAPELHLVGHSAGAILQVYLIPALLQRGLPIKSLTLYAPACTTDLFKDMVLRLVNNQPIENQPIERITIFNLTDQAEKDDSVAVLYRKSLLYLVSEAFEPRAERKGQPLLGMDKFIKGAEGDTALQAVLGGEVSRTESTVIYSVGGDRNITLASRSTSHGGFDNDPDTLNSTLRIILGTNQPEHPFDSQTVIP